MQNTLEIVFVIDDDPSVCRALARLLDASGYTVETYHSALDFLARQAYIDDGCIILDVNMPGMDGLDLQMRLKERSIDLPIIFLTGHGTLPMGIQAMKRGAADFLTKPVDETDLLNAVQLNLESRRKARHLLKGGDPRPDKLTPRELEVLKLLLGGAINKQIAGKLKIAEKTVKAHRSKVMGKMSVSSATELGAVCTRLGISPTYLNDDDDWT